MTVRKKAGKREWRWRQPGFSILEMMIALVILLGVTAIVMSGMMQMTKVQGSVANRTEMHSSVRSATELLQQEIGQAGKISLASSGPVTTSTLVHLVDPTIPVTINPVTVTSAAGMFNGEKLVIDAGDYEETVTISNLSLAANTFTATFILPHNDPTVTPIVTSVPVRVSGAFASGIVPKSAPNGSGDFLLKLYGDINADGNMEYIEYKCDTSAGYLYRNVVTIATGATKPAVDPSMVILSNVQPNPPDPGTSTPAPCFKYQEKSVGTDTFVVDVSVTLTVQTQNRDPQTNQFQTETKALLNVSPRNVFEGWQLASGGVANRVQPIPATVTSLLP